MPKASKESGRDRATVASRPHASGSATDRLVAEFSDRTRSEISAAIEIARIQMAPMVDDQELLERARDFLDDTAGEQPDTASPDS